MNFVLSIRTPGERQRRSILQPRVASPELPWEYRHCRANPEGVASRRRFRAMQPRWGWEHFFRGPRVGAPASRQPWAVGWNAVGVLRPRTRFDGWNILGVPCPRTRFDGWNAVGVLRPHITCGDPKIPDPFYP
jgi:hypothetical protein